MSAPTRDRYVGFVGSTGESERDRIIWSMELVSDQIRALLGDMGSDPRTRDYSSTAPDSEHCRRRFDDLNNELSSSLGMTSAKSRTIEYLQLHVGEVVTGAALAGLTGITAYPRRIRELRRGDGYDISSKDEVGSQAG